MYMIIETKNPGVYQIVCKTTQKIYVGSAVNLNKRIKRHLHELRNQKHCSKHLQNAFNLYGEESFYVIILEEFESITRYDLLTREQFFLDELTPYNRETGYNTCHQAKSPAQLNFTKERKDKLSNSLKLYHLQNPVSQETRNKIGDSNRGKKMSLESIEKIRISKTGLKQTEDNISKRAKSYSFIKDGILYEGSNLKRFAEEHNCHRPNLGLVLRGIRKSHHGFTLPPDRDVM